MNEFVESIIGTTAPAKMLGMVIFIALGWALAILQDTNTRNVNSTATPAQFSWRFFFLDNIKRIALTLIIVFVQLRFFEQLTGQPLNEYTAFLLGFSSDCVSAMGKRNSKILQQDRDKIMNTKKTAR